VTVSYFEWLKNLSHVRFGRMEKRFQGSVNAKIIQSIEKSTGKKISPAEKKAMLEGPDEISLVYSGLEETMINAYDKIRDTYWETKGINDMRTAAFVVALRKIVESYSLLGIFP